MREAFRALFSLLLRGASAEGAPAANAMDTEDTMDVGCADPVLLLCGMYRSILCRWGDPILTKGHLAQHGAALAVLNGIAYADSALLRALWAHLSGGLDARCFADPNGPFEYKGSVLALKASIGFLNQPIDFCYEVRVIPSSQLTPYWVGRPKPTLRRQLYLRWVPC